MKALPWILVLVCVVTAGFYFTSNKRNEAESARLRQEISEARLALEEAKTAATQSDDTSVSRKEREELIRLRNEVGQLRREKQQLGNQVQQAQQRNDQLVQAQQARQAQQQLQSQNQQAAQEAEEQKIIQARNQCINNLRQIDGAIQQWALENKQAGNAAVVIEQLAPFFRNSTPPVCPAGGVYSVSTVESMPACNVDGHALPP